MSASRVKASTIRRKAAETGQTEKPGVSRPSRVLAERTQAVVAVGAWVDGGQDCLDDPCDLALLTEELQAGIQREDDENLQRFQDEVQRRLAKQAHVGRGRWQLHPKVTPDRRISHGRVLTHQVSVGDSWISGESAAPWRRRNSPGSGEAMRQVRLRLAACRLIQQDEASSDLPVGRWKVSSTRHRKNFHMLRPGEDVVEEEEQEKTEAPFFSGHHDSPLVQQKVGGQALWGPETSPPDPGSRVPQALWPLTNHEQEKQLQSQFLLRRRQAMSREREQAKENRQLRKHLKRTERLKAEKEKVRLEEEARLERAWQLADIKRKLEERELLILERLKLEEEEERERKVQLQRRKREEKEKDTARLVEALRARMKERLSQLKLELPPLCCCASSFWDSHPDTCANNCVFHDNPKEYSKALHSTLVSLDLQ